MIRIEHNAETGEIQEIELSAAEIKEIQEKQKKAEQRDAKATADAAIKAAEKAALLEKLGITADEAALLLS
jgi:hypothetical protein